MNKLFSLILNGPQAKPAAEPSQEKEIPKMNQPNDGGMAFPNTETHTMTGYFGMSYRQYVAAHVLAGYMTDYVISKDKTDDNELAEFAVRLADALIAALQRTPAK